MIFFEIVKIYLPCFVQIFQGDEASRAWAGGYNGRQIMDRFFPQAAALLSLAGVFYCVIIEENDPGTLVRYCSVTEHHTFARQVASWVLVATNMLCTYLLVAVQRLWYLVSVIN